MKITLVFHNHYLAHSCVVWHHRTGLDQAKTNPKRRARDRLHLLGRGQRLHWVLCSVCEKYESSISGQDDHCWQCGDRRNGWGVDIVGRWHRQSRHWTGQCVHNKNQDWRRVKMRRKKSTTMISSLLIDAHSININYT